MATKQQRKTAARKARQAARRARDNMIKLATQNVGDPTTAEAEKMSNQKLQRVINLHRHYPMRAPATIDMEEVVAALDSIEEKRVSQQQFRM